jgi:hypothetical protein
MIHGRLFRTSFIKLRDWKLICLTFRNRIMTN